MLCEFLVYVPNCLDAAYDMDEYTKKYLKTVQSFGNWTNAGLMCTNKLDAWVYVTVPLFL
jgi:hypothetical protein